MGPHEQWELIDRYCVGCHNDAELTGELSFEHLKDDPLEANQDVWEAVIRKLRLGAMPPLGEPRPTGDEARALVRYLESGLDAFFAAKPNPGRSPIHRLNRAEYGNAIRDLLDLKVDVSSLLPPDSASYGFDNNSDTLKVSPLLLSRYLAAAEKISAVAVGDPEVGEEALMFLVPNGASQDQYIDGMPLGTQGGTVVDYNFPLDAEYLFKGELWATYAGGARGLEGHELPYHFVITIDGREILRTPIGGKQGNDLGYRTAGGAIKDARDRMQARAAVTAGPHRVGYGFVKTPGGSTRTQENISPSVRASTGVFEPYGAPKLQYVFIGGPFDPTAPGDTPSRRRIFVCQPSQAAEETTCAEEILAGLARRAFSRDPSEDEMVELMAFFQEGRRVGGFEKGIQAALPRILAGPEFIYRVHPAPPDVPQGAPYPVTDGELAMRLALFLWSSIPDAELFAVAGSGDLRKPPILREQVERMLRDERSHAFVENFAGQWLYLRNLERAMPDVVDFNEWDDNLRQAFRRETELFFDSIVRENRSVLDLLTADYTFVNERLARHYGIPDVYGPSFRRVKLEDDNRRGLLGQGSILTVTSVSNRTSPVNRGKWVLAQLLNSPPPPPPPGVDTNLPMHEEGSAPTSMRSILEIHRQNPQCAGCHSLMDPIGLALENFDGIGKWRATDNGAAIDASTTLFNGDRVTGPTGLRAALLARPEVFVDTVVRQLMTYALGRGVGPTDDPVVRRIVREAESDDYRFASLVLGIVQSVPFQMRVSAPPDSAGTVATATRGEQ
jgi:hypothetical protein